MRPESESETRKYRIDRQLTDAGWSIIDYVKVHDLSSLNGYAVEEFPTANGPADYALVVINQSEKKNHLWTAASQRL